MNLTDLRTRAILPGQPAKSPKQRAEKEPPTDPNISPPAEGDSDSAREARRSRITAWLREFCRLHQINVQILDGLGRVLIDAVQEPAFCTSVKSARPSGCPDDCGRSRHAVAHAAKPHIFHCPYHLSNIAWVVGQQEENAPAWTVILGRTLATQEQMTSCLEVVREADEIGEETLATLGSIPWMAEPQLASAARFLQRSLELILGIPPATAESSKSAEMKGKALATSPRNRDQG
jgi:hypothetical protein